MNHHLEGYQYVRPKMKMFFTWLQFFLLFSAGLTLLLAFTTQLTPWWVLTMILGALLIITFAAAEFTGAHDEVIIPKECERSDEVTDASTASRGAS